MWRPPSETDWPLLPGAAQPELAPSHSNHSQTQDGPRFSRESLGFAPRLDFNGLHQTPFMGLQYQFRYGRAEEGAWATSLRLTHGNYSFLSSREQGGKKRWGRQCWHNEYTFIFPHPWQERGGWVTFDITIGWFRSFFWSEPELAGCRLKQEVNFSLLEREW